jgi:N-acetyl sugar amidotransferase
VADLKNKMAIISDFKICSKCIYDERVANITFDDNGVCNYCHQVEKLVEDYGTGAQKGIDTLNGIVAEIKAAGKNKKYDCVVGVSGGTDSSYMIYWALQNGLRPLAVHYDNTWNTSIATENIRKVLQHWNVDLFTHVIDNKEADDIFKSFFEAGVPEIEASTDLALAETMYRAAAQYKVQYVLEGHSFVTEGITPLGKNYFDGKYIKSIHRRYGKKKMNSYPLMSFYQFMKWTVFYKIKKIRPYWYLAYTKEDAMSFLKKECNWSYYGGHHLENRMTAFFHGIYSPQKFKMDYRNNTLSALVRNGLLDRDEAWDKYNSPPAIEPELLSYFKKRLNLSDEAYEIKMKEAPKYWWQFPTYKKRFELLRPMFFILAKANLVPMSFYLKYCFPVKNK